MKNSHTALLSTAIVLVAAVAGVVISVSRNSAAADSAVPSSIATEAATEPAVTETIPAVQPNSLHLSPTMLTLGKDEAFTPSAVYDGSRPAEGAAFSADRTNVLTVEPSAGKMAAASNGYANVTAASNNGLTDVCCVTVKNAPTAVRFPNKSVTMQKGETGVLHVETVSDSEGFSHAVFQSENPEIADVSESGEITAKAAGTAVVTAAVYNGKTASLSVTVLDNSGFTDKTTVSDSVLLQDAGWKYPAVASVPAGAAVQQYGAGDDGRWLKVKYGDSYGWMYNKAFGDTRNYSAYTVETLPVMADDLLFDIGTDKRAIFDYVYDISYDTEGDDTTENLCVQYFERMRGSCYHHAAMLCYLYNRCGYETVRLVGISAYDGESEHSWCMSKTEEGWRHVDAQKFTIRTADEQYFIEDYSQYFNWDRDAFPVVTTKHTELS